MSKIADASMKAGTEIDRWLRDNPDASPTEAVGEFMRRFRSELGAAGQDLPPGIERALTDGIAATLRDAAVLSSARPGHPAHKKETRG